MNLSIQFTPKIIIYISPTVSYFIIAIHNISLSIAVVAEMTKVPLFSKTKEVMVAVGPPSLPKAIIYHHSENFILN